MAASQHGLTLGPRLETDSAPLVTSAAAVAKEGEVVVNGDLEGEQDMEATTDSQARHVALQFQGVPETAGSRWRFAGSAGQ